MTELLKVRIIRILMIKLLK